MSEAPRLGRNQNLGPGRPLSRPPSLPTFINLASQEGCLTGNGVLESGVTCHPKHLSLLAGTSLCELPCCVHSEPEPGQAPGGPDKMGPWGRGDESMLGCPKVTAHPRASSRSSRSPSLGCREEAGETSLKRAPATPPPPRTFIGSKECWPRLSPSACLWACAPGRKQSTGMFWTSRALHSDEGIRAAVLRGLLGRAFHSEIQSGSRNWTHLSTQLRLNRFLCSATLPSWPRVT